MTAQLGDRARDASEAWAGTGSASVSRGCRKRYRGKRGHAPHVDVRATIGSFRLVLVTSAAPAEANPVSPLTSKGRYVLLESKNGEASLSWTNAGDV
jgi:hypothetical protein